MAVLRSSSKRLRGSSSSNSKILRSADVSDPSLNRSKSSRSRVASIGVQNMSWWSLVTLQLCFFRHAFFTISTSRLRRLMLLMLQRRCFFAELTTTNKVRCVKFCTSMGPKKSISGDKNNGCCYCKFYNVQHPRGGGFKAGGAGLFRKE